MKSLWRTVIGGMLVLALTTPIAARQDVSTTDVQRLQDLVNDVGADVAS